jgi:hypothetical protein
VISKDDYLAFKKIQEIFERYKVGPVDFMTDDEALDTWRRPLIITIGGPRSNMKLAQIMGRAVWAALRRSAMTTRIRPPRTVLGNAGQIVTYIFCNRSSGFRAVTERGEDNTTVEIGLRTLKKTACDVVSEEANSCASPLTVTRIVCV